MFEEKVSFDRMKLLMKQNNEIEIIFHFSFYTALLADIWALLIN